MYSRHHNYCIVTQTQTQRHTHAHTQTNAHCIHMYTHAHTHVQTHTQTGKFIPLCMGNIKGLTYNITDHKIYPSI